MEIDPNVDMITWSTWFDEGGINMALLGEDDALLKIEQLINAPTHESNGGDVYVASDSPPLDGASEASEASEASSGAPSRATSPVRCHVQVTDCVTLGVLASTIRQKIGSFEVPSETHPFWRKQSSRNPGMVDDAVSCMVAVSGAKCTLCDAEIFPGETVMFAARNTDYCYDHPYHAMCGAYLKARELDAFRMNDQPPICICMADNKCL
jgi:hypothetical protein